MDAGQSRLPYSNDQARRAIHRVFEDVRPHVAGTESGETIEGLKDRVRVGKDLKEVI